MALMVDSNFPGGGVENVRIINDTNLFFTAPVDGSLSNRSMWFAFRIRGAQGRNLTFRQEMMERTLEVNIYGTYAAVRPVVREGTSGEWKRISDVTYDRESLQFSFRYTPESNETYFAFCYPYQLSDLQSFFSKYEGREDVTELSLGKTSSGRPYPAYLLGRDDKAPNKKLVFLKCRQHSGETPGSFVLEGLMQQILADDELGQSLREKALFFVVPMVHLDGVEDGHYGKDAPPVDFNRDWRRSSRRKEIRTIIAKLDELTQDYPLILSSDFHGPHPGGPSHIMPARFSELGAEGWDRVCQLRAYAEALMEPFASNRVCDLEDIYFSWAGENYAFMETAFTSQTYGADTMSTENAYNCDRTGRPLNPSQWRKMGQAYAKAIHDVWFDDHFRFDYDPRKLPNLEQVWEHWAMISIPENIHVHPEGEDVILEAHHDYDRTYISRTAFVTSREPISSGMYELECTGNAMLKVYAYQYAGGQVDARSDAFEVHMQNETLRLPCDMLCHSTKTKTEYCSVRAAFHFTDLDGVMRIKRLP